MVLITDKEDPACFPILPKDRAHQVNTLGLLSRWACHSSVTLGEPQHIHLGLPGDIPSAVRQSFMSQWSFKQKVVLKWPFVGYTEVPSTHMFRSPKTLSLSSIFDSVTWKMVF